MATGMMNSQTASKQPTLRSGETLASTPTALKDPNSKTFHHMVKGAKFVMPDGLELRFVGGQLTTNDPAVIEELSRVADRATSMIYTNPAVVDAVKAQQTAAAKDASDTAGDLKTDK